MQQKFRTRIERMNLDKQDKSGTLTGKHADVTEKIVQAFCTVYNQLGPLIRDGLKWRKGT
jgi:hypothetical protein